ncbi:Hvo_1808 family surface protein [Natrinema halophilum]|uniref:Hvo_1808 family surface protein n=1 Tax=Natrinema halophilum TaxID=1699371 RepID=UPI001C52D7EA|nr:Hvo_1808 family surface protein [Natrinema halophilum]UHQ96006.1 Hvo_1808 family surface protein [Natrinema halophilum]
MKRGRLLAVLVLVVLSGCALPGDTGGFDADRELGHVGDYASGDDFTFDTSNGLTRNQLEAVKYRAMARIEVVRGLKFSRDVELEVVSRAEYRNRRAGTEGNASAFRNELWRGAFVVDGETDVGRAFDDLYGDSVQGYYVNDRVVIVSDDTDRIRIDRWVLVHELTHALQDQQFGIARESDRVDGVRAENGLIEGEANYVSRQYDRRCGAEWQCMPERRGPTASGETLSDRPFNVGLFLSIYAPYAEGTPFVADLHERDGWDSVDRAHGNPPRSTSQLIHPDHYPDREPIDVAIPDRSSDDWRPITKGTDGSNGGAPVARTETLGEATLFATLWANGVIDRPLTAGTSEFATYNYSHPATAGWAGDAVQVYRNMANRNRTGHVWRLTWDSPADAAAFADAYRTLLTRRGAEIVESTAVTERDVYRIPDGTQFAGAYRIDVTSDTVEIVGAPSVDDIAAIHAAGPVSEQNGSLETASALEPATPISSSRSEDDIEPQAVEGYSSPRDFAGRTGTSQRTSGTTRAAVDG